MILGNYSWDNIRCRDDVRYAGTIKTHPVCSESSVATKA